VLAGRAAVVQRAAGDQAAHAVADDREARDGARPLRQQLLEQRCQRAAVGRHVQAAVV